MDLYNIKDNNIKPIGTKPFKLEKDIQNLIETNINSFLKLELVKSEFPIEKYRLDSLCYDKETKSFVIIEYKRDKNYSVIDQGFSYLSTVLENKGELVLEYQEKFDIRLKKDSIDWSQIRIVFISPSFSKYQKDSINFKDLPIELYEIKQYEDDIVSLNKIQSKSSSTSINNLSNDGVIGKVKKEVRVYNENYHLYEKTKDRTEWVVKVYFELKERITNLGEFDIVYRGDYISYRLNSPFVDIIIYQKGVFVIINLDKGELNDPNNDTEDLSIGKHWGNGDYGLLVKESSDLDYVMYLIKQSFEFHSKS